MGLYRFGETISIPFWTARWKPKSFYDKLIQNRKQNLHTLCLLDIKVKEQSEENMMRGRKIFEPPRFMTVQQGLEQLLECHDEEGGEKNFLEDSKVVCVGIARLGAPDQIIKAGTARQLLEFDFGGPLHALV